MALYIVKKQIEEKIDIDLKFVINQQKHCDIVKKRINFNNVSIDVHIVTFSHAPPNRNSVLQFFNASSSELVVTCNEFYIQNQVVGKGNHVESNPQNYTSRSEVNFRITIEKPPSPTVIQTLDEDTVLTDFELYAENTSVKVHKSVLASASPVFKAMFAHWDEKNEKRVEVPEATMETLKYFKKYIYMRTIEDNVSIENLLQLMRLSSYYMMPDLEKICSEKIEEQVTNENIKIIFDAAVQFNYGQLLGTIIRNMTEESILAIQGNASQSKE